MLEPDLGTTIVIVLTTMTLVFVAGASLTHVARVRRHRRRRRVDADPHRRVPRRPHLRLRQRRGRPERPRLPDAAAAHRARQRRHRTASGSARAARSSSTCPAPTPTASSPSSARSWGSSAAPLVIALFAFLMIRGFRVILRARDDFGSLLAVGIVSWIGYQALINIGGITRDAAAHRHPAAVPELRRLGAAGDARGIGILLSVSRYGVDAKSTGEEAAARRRLGQDRAARRARPRRAGARAAAGPSGRERGEGGLCGRRHRRPRVPEPRRRPRARGRDARRAASRSTCCTSASAAASTSRSCRREGIAVPRDRRPGRCACRRRSPFAGNMLKLARGVVQSFGILRRFRPDVVFATGGYASVPVGVAARLLRRPLVVYLPDVTPGWAVRLLSRLATRMTTTSERALAHLPAAKTAVVGYPVRERLLDASTAPAARARLGLPAEAKVLLVTAGSLGARRINEAVVARAAAAARPLRRAARHRRRATRRWPSDAARRAHAGAAGALPRARLHSTTCPRRWSRPTSSSAAPGASTLGELPAAGAPAILVPGRVRGLVAGAERRVPAGRRRGRRCSATPSSTGSPPPRSTCSPTTRASRACAPPRRALARPDAARDIARILLEVAA